MVAMRAEMSEQQELVDKLYQDIEVMQCEIERVKELEEIIESDGHKITNLKDKIAEKDLQLKEQEFQSKILSG